MKSTLRTVALAILCFVNASLFAQTSTKGFSFQGYAIDPDGKTLSSTGITVKFTLSSVSNAGSPFTEEHVLTSDAFGVFHAIVGNSSVAKNTEFSKLDFTKKGDENYTLKVEVKKTSGGSYTTISNEPLNAVPYARVAENGVPVGTIVAFAGPKANIPAGWLYCDGSAISRTTYSQLYAAIGTSWGYGDQATTFNLPFTQGMFLRGVNDGTGWDPNASGRIVNKPGGNTGDNVGSFQESATALPRTTQFTGATGNDGDHTHSYVNPLNSGNLTWEIQANDVDGTNNGRTKEYPNWSSTGGAAHTHWVGINGGGDSETRPRNVYIYYIIKY